MGANKVGFAVVVVLLLVVVVVVAVDEVVVVVVDDGNDQVGVVIGNEAVWNRLSGPQDLEPRLLGMDLLRGDYLSLLLVNGEPSVLGMDLLK